MLANSQDAPIQSGSLSRNVQLPSESRYEILEFIAGKLPRWRGDPQRPHRTSETALTENLCDYLTSAARMSPGWDILQFRTEVADEEQKGRKIDLAPKPCGATIWIEGICYTQYQSLMPIECKRLPTPRESDRDEREYVFNRHASTGGIQRFKAGHHGRAHTLGAMIGYVQEGTATDWSKQVCGWISELAEAGIPEWSSSDALELTHDDLSDRVAQLRSSHKRAQGLADIELRHLWVMMN